jgi:hypothetical protein
MKYDLVVIGSAPPAMWERFALLNLVKKLPASKKSEQGAHVSIGDASLP